MTEWTTFADLATGIGTLALAIATVGSVRSANRAALAAERSVQAGLRPLLIGSRLQDLEQKVGFADEHWVRVPGGGGTAEVTADAVYLTMSVRNVGDGVAVLHGWSLLPVVTLGEQHRPDVTGFHRLTRDIYVPAGDIGFWQGAIREPGTEEYALAREAIEQRRRIGVDLLYGDVEGGQRVISRFTLQPARDGTWLATPARHWNVDRPDPR